MLKLSVIVPVYNTAPYLKQCFDSLLKQTYENIEFIIINDGSTDNSSEIIKEYAQKSPKFKVITQDNKGYSGARNSALEIASGDYIGFVDSDDYISPDMYEKMIKEAEQNADIVSCGFYRVYQNNKQEDSNRLYVNLSKNGNYPELILDHGFVWNRIYRTKMLRDNNITFPTDISFGEDTFFHRCALFAAKNVVYISEPLYFYRQERKNAQTTLTDKRNMSFIKNCEKLYCLADEKTLPWLNHLTLSLCACGYERIAKEYKQEYFEKFKNLVNRRETFKILYPDCSGAGLMINLRYLSLKILHPVMYYALRNNNKLLFDCVINIRIILQNLSKVK